MTAPRLGHARALACALVMGLLLGGCVSRDISDLERFAQEKLARPGGRLDPPPDLAPYERYVYQAAERGKRDPFASFMDTLPAEEGGKDKVMSEEQKRLAREVFERNKEELERFELDSLRMVGTLENEQRLWGIVQDPSGVIHRVTVGNYIGRNTGKIIGIEEDEIQLREIVNGPDGDLVQRSARLALAGE